MERPGEITGLAVLCFLASGGLLLELARELLLEPSHHGGLLTYLLITAAPAALGWGLWGLRNWARRLTVLVAVLFLFYGFAILGDVVMIVTAHDSRPFSILIALSAFILTFSCWVILIMFQARVKRAFPPRAEAEQGATIEEGPMAETPARRRITLAAGITSLIGPTSAVLYETSHFQLFANPLLEVWLLAIIAAFGVGIGVLWISRGAKVAGTVCLLTNALSLLYMDSSFWVAKGEHALTGKRSPAQITVDKSPSPPGGKGCYRSNSYLNLTGSGSLLPGRPVIDALLEGLIHLSNCEHRRGPGPHQP